MPLGSRATKRPGADKTTAPANDEVKLTARRGKTEPRDEPADPPADEAVQTGADSDRATGGNDAREEAPAPRQRKPRADAGQPRAKKAPKAKTALTPGATPKELRAQLKDLEAAYKDAQKRQKAEQAELTRKHGDELSGLQRQHREVSTALSAAVFTK